MSEIAPEKEWMGLAVISLFFMNFFLMAVNQPLGYLLIAGVISLVAGLYFRYGHPKRSFRLGASAGFVFACAGLLLIAIAAN